ncbi:sulfotransferase [Rhodospirillales bacterium]|nr:sulfotransferase [Rhodospirillales bacterium]
MFQEVNRNVEDILSRQLFFIAATEKSGTTWMQLMLDGHPEIVCRGEGQFVSKLAGSLGGGLKEYSSFIEGLNKNVFAETDGFPTFDRDDLSHLIRMSAGLLLSKYDITENVRAVGEKTPGNVRYLQALLSLFPNAKFVLMVRDIRDIIVSGHVHLKRQHGKAGEELIQGYAKRVAKIWAQDVARAQTFMANNKERCVFVRYEDLHAQPLASMKPVIDHLGVDSRSEMIEMCVEAGRFQNLSKGRERGQEDINSQFRKGIVGDWQHVLDQATRAIILEEAGETLTALGYINNDDWVASGG